MAPTRRTKKSAVDQTNRPTRAAENATSPRRCLELAGHRGRAGASALHALLQELHHLLHAALLRGRHVLAHTHDRL